jgi:hypothetical protein
MASENVIDIVTHATFRQKLFAAILLMISTIGLVFVWVYYLNQIESILQLEVKVEWESPAQVYLKPGPPSFWYDRTGKSLVYKGIIDKQQKDELITLLKPDDKGVSKQLVSSYWAAVDKLAYLSRKTLHGFIQYLIILGGLSGLLGVQLRSLTNFVGNACFKNVLDISRWWPWYIIRPFSGFLLGMVIVIIIQAGLFKPGETLPLSTLWWAGIAILAGFGADDFAQRLRLLTQTLFGQSK